MQDSTAPAGPHRRRDIAGLFAVSALLIAVTAALYWPVLGYPYIPAWDDGQYVLENPYVRQGLSWKGAAWAFTSFHAGNWHPLTFLSHMLDVQLFGLDASGPHGVNVLLHAANAVLLLLVLHRMTGSLGKSAVVSALFAFHPLHVESVAWIAERKDVLSALFWMLTVLLYIRYAERPGAFRYGAVVVTFLLGLLAKPMLVTLPFVLLLFDYWPLGRFASAGAKPDGRRSGKLVVEKFPLFALSAASSLVTIAAQKAGGAIGGLDSYHPVDRIANALVAVVGYLGRTAWPVGLAAFYPHPGSALPLWQPLGAALLILAMSVLALRAAGRHPWLPVGWFSYLVMLMPVIGVVQVGMQSMADRYTYLPLTGVFIIISWGAAELLAQPSMERIFGRGKRRVLPWGAAALVAAALFATASFQVRTWADGVTLFHRAVSVSDNWWTRFNLATSLADQRRFDEAIVQFRVSLALRPGFAMGHFNLGAVLEQLGRADEAGREYEEAVRIDPGHVRALNNLGKLFFLQGRDDRAMDCFQRALRHQPDAVEPRFNLATVLRKTGRLDAAEREYREVIRRAPAPAAAHEALAMLLFQAGRDAEAWSEVAAAREGGYAPDPGFIRALTARTPDPGRSRSH